MGHRGGEGEGAGAANGWRQRRQVFPLPVGRTRRERVRLRERRRLVLNDSFDAVVLGFNILVKVGQVPRAPIRSTRRRRMVFNPSCSPNGILWVSEGPLGRAALPDNRRLIDGRLALGNLPLWASIIDGVWALEEDTPEVQPLAPSWMVQVGKAWGDIGGQTNASRTCSRLCVAKPKEPSSTARSSCAA